MRIGHPIRGDAAPVARKAFRVPTRDRKIVSDSEARLWQYYDQIPEVGFWTRVLANSAKKVAYYPAVTVGASEPEAVTDRRVLDVWASVGGETAVANWVGALVTHLEVTGQGWLVAVDSAGVLGSADTALGDLTWRVASTAETRRLVKAATGGEALDHPSVWRIWTPHPNDWRAADSPMRRCADQCEILVALAARRRRDIRSRIFAGVWPLPDTLRGELGPSGVPWADALDDALAATVDGGSLMPLIVYVQPDEAAVMRGGPIPLAVDDPARIDDLEERTIRRLANGIDAPAELLLGVGDMNHWTGWLIRQDTFDQHLDPLILRILDGLSEWWRSLLEVSGVAATGNMIWRNPATAVSSGNGWETAVALYDRFELSGDALREAADRDETVKPSETEISQRVSLGQRPVTTAPSGQPGPPASTNPATVQAAGTSVLTRLGRYLADTDVAAMTALERETASQISELVADTQARLAAIVAAMSEPERDRYQVTGSEPDLAAILGRDTVAVLLGGLVVNEALINADPFNGIISSSQERVGNLLAGVNASWDRLLADDDRTVAVSVITATVAAAAADALFSRAPVTVGEVAFEGVDLVPYQALRAGYDWAGGGSVRTATDMMSGVGNGVRATARLADVGVQTAGFRWVYGTSPRRTFEPHLRLDGTEFTRWDSLTQTPDGDWVGGDVYFPGDHRGCRCGFERLMVLE